jgi:endonuclease G
MQNGGGFVMQTPGEIHANTHQVHNARAWAKIEQDTRKYVMRARGDVFVYTGPLFDARPPTVGSGRVTVPSHLFKVVYDPSTEMSWAHLHANRAETEAAPPIRYTDFVKKTNLYLLHRTQR